MNKHNPVLLQTSRANISSVDEKNKKNSRIMFDTGSQLSYISPKTRDELKLPTLTKSEISVTTFGLGMTKKTLDVVEFAVKSKDQSMNIHVKAL